jgi:hypothetical protein
MPLQFSHWLAIGIPECCLIDLTAALKACLLASAIDISKIVSSMFLKSMLTCWCQAPPEQLSLNQHLFSWLKSEPVPLQSKPQNPKEENR